MGKQKQNHRPKLTTDALNVMTLIDRPMAKSEMRLNKAAQAALDKEWARLEREARAHRKKANVGLVFGLCVKKGSELPLYHPNR